MARAASFSDASILSTPVQRGDTSGLLAYCVWVGQVLAWAFLLCAMISFHPADWPSAAIVPHNEMTRNWCGLMGSWPAYQGMKLLGWGAWVLLALWGLYIFVHGFIARVGHAWVRFLGAILMAASIAAVQGLLAPQSGPIPDLGGGTVGATIGGYLGGRFSNVGSVLLLMAMFFVGAVVALDVWVILAPQWAARQLAKATPPVARATATAAEAGWEVSRGVGSRLGGWIGDLNFTGLLSKPAKKKGRRGRATDLEDEDVLGAGGDDDGGSGEQKPEGKKKAGTRGKKAQQPTDVIDENAGGLGGVEPFDPSKHSSTVTPAGEVEAAVAAEAKSKSGKKGAKAPEPAAEATDEADAEEGEVEQPKKTFTPEELQAKIAKLPLKLAATDKRAATADDLRDIQSMGDLEGYKFPGLEHLEEPEANFSATMETYVRSQAGDLARAMKEYRIEGEVVGIQSGPVITNYEIRLAPGTKVSALTSVQSDLARSLKAVNVRIVANTAGRDTVGVEVPNSTKEKVRLKELMGRSEKYQGMALPMFLGKDASGEPLIADLTKMPHMLIAGTTGSGKSVCMSSILMSFLYTKKPNELKLVLVDPKMVELSQFKDIPHLMCPVVTEMGKAAAILEWAVRKMDERYELLAEAGCTNIAAYNNLTWEELKERFNPTDETEANRIPKKLPYMVFVIDELADLMMTNKEVETSIIRLAQKARAVGMHLILATQRPQANVVTGLIKSNMPSRIAFKVASGMDSRIVMDQKGAELLLGQGDMLFLSPRSSELCRAQGTLVDDKEIRRVVKFLKEIAQPTYERSLMQIRTGSAAAGEIAEGESEMGGEISHDGYAVAQEDPLFERAVDIVMETKIGSVSMLQRRLAIGYTRAARLVELMGHVGILGAHKGTQARELSMGQEEWNAMKAQIAAMRDGADPEKVKASLDPKSTKDSEGNALRVHPSAKPPVSGAADEAEEEMYEEEAEEVDEEEVEEQEDQGDDEPPFEPSGRKK